MNLAAMTSPEIGALLKNSDVVKGVILPVGSFEQHGPLLPLGCDTEIAEGAAGNLAASLETSANYRGFVLPAVTYTPVPGAEMTPGTISTSFDLIGLTLHDILSGVARSPWDFAIIINSHAQNHGRVIEAAMASTGGKYGRILPAVIINIYEYAYFCADLQLEAGSHAAEFEIALYAYYSGKPVPEASSDGCIPPQKRRPGNMYGLELLPRSYSGVIAPRPPDVHAANLKAQALGALVDEAVASAVKDNLQVYFSDWKNNSSV